MKIYISDIRRAGHCVSGTKNWFEKHELDFKSFLREGIEEELFVATGDALALRVVTLKQARDG